MTEEGHPVPPLLPEKQHKLSIYLLTAWDQPPPAPRALQGQKQTKQTKSSNANNTEIRLSHPSNALFWVQQTNDPNRGFIPFSAVVFFHVQDNYQDNKTQSTGDPSKTSLLSVMIIPAVIIKEIDKYHMWIWKKSTWFLNWGKAKHAICISRVFFVLTRLQECIFLPHPLQELLFFLKSLQNSY